MWALRWSGLLLVFVAACEARFVPAPAESDPSGDGAGAPSEPTGTEAGKGGTGGSGGGGVSGKGGAGTEGGRPGSSAGDGGTPPGGAPGCEALAEVGVFQEITPPEVKAGLGQRSAAGDIQAGPFSLEIDPIRHGTYYVGTEHQGLWKSTDCGDHWVAIATGKNGASINRGINWTLAIDHGSPDTLYTSAAYSAEGLFKSTDGGVSWNDIWSSKTQPELSKAFEYNFVHQLVVDPRDARHLLLTMHESCQPPHSGTCILESEDAGATWQLHEGDASWEPDSSATVHFLGEAGTWLVAAQTNGMWRTTDFGQTWARLEAMIGNPQAQVALLEAADGAFYLGGSDGLWRSPDGGLDTWELIPDSGPFVAGLASDGKALFASNCYAEDYCEQPRYLTSNDGKTWEPMSGVPELSNGGLLRYDAGHRLLVSSNGRAGVWRVRVP
ncbi:MAG: hypothetical protein K0R38_6891 [Polyangiaceae bacterium]|nr:hypothetical protein [Polyangiaceae bacterium]